MRTNDQKGDDQNDISIRMCNLHMWKELIDGQLMYLNARWGLTDDRQPHTQGGFKKFKTIHLYQSTIDKQLVT